MDENDFEDLLRQQNLMMRSVAMESETDSKIKVIGIINELAMGKNKKIQREAVILEAENEGMSYDEVDRIIEVLKSDGILVEPERGVLRKT